jgi:hypothetical protein
MRRSSGTSSHCVSCQGLQHRGFAGVDIIEIPNPGIDLARRVDPHSGDARPSDGNIPRAARCAVRIIGDSQAVRKAEVLAPACFHSWQITLKCEGRCKIGSRAVFALYASTFPEIHLASSGSCVACRATGLFDFLGPAVANH